MEPFVRANGKLVYLRVEDIQQIYPTEDGCTLLMRGAAEDGPHLKASADTIARICNEHRKDDNESR